MTNSSSITEIQSADTLTGEMLLFGLLGRAIYTYGDRPWLQSLADEDVFSEAPFAENQPEVQQGLALLQAWSQAHRGGMSDAAFDDLRVDYTRLLIGPGASLAAPWESVYFDKERLVFVEQTLQVREFYRRFGLEAVNLHKEPDDHIGLELGFLSHLARLALEALEQSQTERVAELVAAQKQFLSEHLIRWGPLWCRVVIDKAQTDFYRGIGKVTLGALLELAARLDVRVPQEGNA